MRFPRIPPALTISAIVHVGLFAGAHVVPLPDHPVPVAQPTPTLNVVEPVEVVLLPAAATTRSEPPATAPQQITAPRPRALPGTTPPRTSEQAASTSVTPTSDTPNDTPSDTSTSDAGPARATLGMRRDPGPRVDLGLPRDRWDDLERAPAGTTATHAPRDTQQLAPSGNGTHRSDQGTFVARVGRDGKVTLKDKRNFNIGVTVPSLSQIGDAVQAWYNDPNKPVGTLPPETIVTQPRVEDPDAADTGVYGEGNSPRVGARENGGPTLPLVGGGFDITDAFMRSKGIDPYASKKLAFLDSTRDERVHIGEQHKREQLAMAAQLMRKNLAAAWHLRDLRERKEALFALWDECVETGTAEQIAAGRSARAMVIGFIRAKLPSGSTQAFTPAEIAALSRRKQSRMPFTPYE